MKKLLLLASTCQLLAMASAPAVSLMLDFGPATVASPYLTTSPGHATGLIPAGETAWNTLTSATPPVSYVQSDNSAAVITLALGQELNAGIINYSTAISNTNLAGSGGGAAGRQPLLTANSIYGSDTTSTAAGRDGFFGGGTATGTGTAVGLRVNGLDAGDYFVYVMARNTNSNAAAVPMNVYASAGSSSGTYTFSSLTPQTQANTTSTTAAYTNQYSQFADGENYVRLNVSLAAGESLFLAVDGADQAVERRGFLNMVQIVPVPEPSAALLGLCGLAPLLRRRR